MEAETGNRTTYICGICRTSPDQLSHHTAHLNSKSHKDKKVICEYEMRRYINEFLFLVDKDYCDMYLQEEFLAEKRIVLEGAVDVTPFHEWVKLKEYYVEMKYNLQNRFNKKDITDMPSWLNWWLNKYTEKTQKCCNYDDKMDRILFLDWKIQYLIKEAETIQKTARSSSSKILNHFDSEIIRKIDNDEISESELLDKFINEICLCDGDNCPHFIADETKKNTAKRCKIVNINNINLSYLVYLKFKNNFVLKEVEVETIMLGKTTKGRKCLWLVKGSGAVNHGPSDVFDIIKKYIDDLLHNIPSIEKDKLKRIRKDFVKSGGCLYRVKDLFAESAN